MSSPLAVLFLIAALFSLYELVRFRTLPQVESYIADREAQLTHLLMNGGMAVMMAPFYGSMAEQAVLLVFGLGVAALITRFILARDRRSGGTIYHLLGLAAMIYAIAAMPAAMAGDIHHMMKTGSTGGAGHWLASILGTLFILDGIATAVLAGVFPRVLLRMEQATYGKSSHSTIIGVIRASAFPHVIMDLGMAWMLLGMS